MITIKSHGFKYGRPDANIFFDVSYFINPWRDEKIKEEKDPEKLKKLVIKFMEKQDGVVIFVDRLAKLMQFYYIMFPNENVQICLCCSAGEYRSPVIAEMLYNKLKDSGVKHINLKQSIYSKI